MDPETGEILAADSTPGFDPNDPRTPTDEVEAKKLRSMSEKNQMEYLNEMWRDPLFNDMPDKCTVGLYHSWVVRGPLPDALLLLARTGDGRVMAVRHCRLPFRGIQFHPESFITEYGPKLLSNFLSL